MLWCDKTLVKIVPANHVDCCLRPTNTIKNTSFIQHNTIHKSILNIVTRNE